MPLVVEHSGDEGMSTRVRSVSVVSGGHVSKPARMVSTMLTEAPAMAI